MVEHKFSSPLYGTDMTKTKAKLYRRGINKKWKIVKTYYSNNKYCYQNYSVVPQLFHQNNTSDTGVSQHAVFHRSEEGP